MIFNGFSKRWAVALSVASVVAVFADNGQKLNSSEYLNMADEGLIHPSGKQKEMPEPAR